MDSLLELDERNVCVSVCQLREKGARPENVFFCIVQKESRSYHCDWSHKNFYLHMCI